MPNALKTRCSIARAQREAKTGRHLKASSDRIHCDTHSLCNQVCHLTKEVITMTVNRKVKVGWLAGWLAGRYPKKNVGRQVPLLLFYCLLILFSRLEHATAHYLWWNCLIWLTIAKSSSPLINHKRKEWIVKTLMTEPSLKSTLATKKTKKPKFFLTTRNSKYYSTMSGFKAKAYLFQNCRKQKTPHLGQKSQKKTWFGFKKSPVFLFLF